MKNKVLFIINTLRGGGAEKVLIDILRNLDFNRFEVTLLLRIRDGIYLDQLPEEVKVLSVYDSEPQPNLSLRIRSKIPFLFQRILRKEVMSAIGDRHFNTIVSFLEGRPLVYHNNILDRADRHISWVHTDLNDTIRDVFFRSRKDETKYYSKMDAVVCVSQSAKSVYDSLFGNTTKPAHVIGNIIDVRNIQEKSRAFKIEHTGFNLICVGRLMPVKRYDRVIGMASILKSRGLNFHLNMLGDGDLREELSLMILESDLTDEISMLGFKTNVYPYMSGSDLLIVSSDIEGYSLVIAEALVLGIPVVSTRVTGPIDLLSKGGGILTDLSPEALADAVERIMTEPDLLQKLSLEAKEIGNSISKEAIISQIESLLQSDM